MLRLHHTALACVTGGSFGFSDNSEDILEYRDRDGWKKLGAMKNARHHSAVSNVKYEDFKDYCN